MIEETKSIDRVLRPMVVIALLSIWSKGLAQGTTYISNIGQSSVGSLDVGSDLWEGVNIVTGNNPGGYDLNSVELGMVAASGNPSSLSVMIYSATGDGGQAPGVSLGTLNGSSDPIVAGDYTYTVASTLTLSPDTRYYIVLTGGTTVASGAFEWSITGSYAYNSTGGWGVLSNEGQEAGYVQSSDDGSSWFGGLANIQFAVNATTIPEPGVLSLFVLASVALGWQAFRKKHG